MKVRMKIILLIVAVVLLTIPTAFAERDVDLFTEMSEEETVVTDDQGRDYILYPDGRMKIGSSQVKRDLSGIIYYRMKQTIQGADLVLTDMQITDIIATDNGFALAGLVIDNRMDENIYGTDLSKLVGTPYTFVFYYDWTRSKTQLGIVTLLEMHELYGFPYNSDNVIDSPYENDYKERYNWSDWLIKPRIISRGGSQSKFWLLSQSKWDMGDTEDAKFAAGEDPFLVISSLKFDRDYNSIMSWSGTHEVYAYPYLLENSARTNDMPLVYRRDYEFTPNATYIQEAEGTDRVVIINMYDDNIGIAHEYDLSVYGKPRYEMTYYK